MPFDASELYWKPFQTLHARLEGIKLDPGSVDAPSLRLLLKEYSPWLGKGLRGFKPPSDASKKAVETESALKAGDDDVPVEPSLRAAALSVSKALHLDQVQSYVLVHRWRHTDAAAAAAAALDPLQLQGGALAPDQLRAIALLYFQERLRLLKSIEDLLLVGEGWSGVGAFDEVIEEALGGLLNSAPGLEEVTFQALKDNLEGDGSGAAPGLSTALLEAAPGAGGGAIALMGASAASTVVVPGMAATRTGRSAAAEDLAALERNVLLSVLALIYFHPRKQCTHERFLELARLCHTRLFAVPLPPDASADASPSPSRLSVKMATLLLLEVLALDADKALQAVAAGDPVDEKVNAFLAPVVQRQVDAELSTWRPAPGDSHAALLLAWAALLTLAGRGDAAAGPAAAATAADALAALRDLSSPRGLAPAAVDMAGTIVLSTAATTLTAFGLEPSVLTPAQTRQAVDMLCNVFSHHPALCDAFWMDSDSVTAQPVRHFLDALGEGYPAAPLPLLRLLTALAGGSAASAAATYLHFARSTELTWLHVLPNPAIGADPRDPGGLATAAELDLPGAKGLTLCAGVTGTPVPFEPDTGLAGAWPVWTPGAPPGSPALLAVRWNLPAEMDTRPWALLCRAFGALHAVRAGGADAATALAELDAALGFLADLCRGDPGATAVNMLRFEAPAPGPEGATASTGQDALALAFQTITALAEATAAPGAPAMDATAASALTHCFRMCGAFVPSAAGRVAAGLLPALGITPLDVSMAARAPGTPPDAPLFRSLLAAEGAAGRYPATLGVLHLTSALLQAACPAPALATLVSFALQRIAPELGRWKYAVQAQRWQLAEACLAVARHALLAVPSELAAANEDGPIAAAAAAVLRSESGLAGCLAPLLPPPAPTLQVQSSAVGAQAAEQVEAAEKCCVAWLRLVPVLLPPVDDGESGDGALLRLAPGALLRAPADGGPPPAAVLLSFLSYPYFAARERALVVRALHCFVAAASAAAPDLPLLPLLPQEGAGVAPAAKSAMAEALEPATARACPALFGAAADVLAAAVTRHPSLVDALLFGSALEGVPGDKENRGANDVGTAAAAATVGKSLSKSSAAAAGPSCLDALWAVLRQWKALLVNCPFAVAKALQVMASLWQAGAPAYRALSALQRQQGFWEAVVGVVEAGAAEGAVPAPVDGEEVEAPAKWTALQAPCWRVAAEAAALQVLAAECFAWRATSPPASDSGPAAAAAEAVAAASVPAEVATFAGSGLLAAAPALLRRYCLALPTAPLERDSRRLAAAAAAELLATAVQDSVFWPSLQAGPCLASQLAAAAQPSLNDAAALGEAAAAVLAPGGEAALRSHPALGTLAEGLLAQAEVPRRLAASADLGTGFAFDGALLARRVGAPLSQESRLLGDLQSWLAAASVGLSLEQARGDAAAALDALATIAEALPAGAGPKTEGGASKEVVEALGAVVEGVVAEAAEAQARPAGTITTGGSASRIHLAEVAAGAKVALMALRRRGKPASDADAYTAAAAAMGLAARWFESLSLVLAVQSTDNGVEVDGDALAAVSSSLLAAALHAVSAVPAVDPGASAAQAGSSEAQQAQHAAQRLLPAVVAIVASGNANGPAAAATSLAAALLERLLPPSAWLPVVSYHLHFGRAMTSALNELGSGDGGNADAARSLELLLLLALQVTQAPAGAALLVEHDVPAVLLSVSARLQAPAPAGGNLLGSPLVAPPPGAPDYSNAYSPVDGSHAIVHRLWCGVLGLAGLLSAAAPAAPAVAAAALQLAVGMDPRLVMAVEPPEGSTAQPVTLAMAQETRYSLFLLCGVARDAGRWRMALPHALPALRRASASLIGFLADPPEGVVCAPVTEAEKIAAKAPPPSAAGMGGWYGAGPRPSAFQWELAEQLMACAQYALAFQLAVAPEVSEAEAAALGPEWPTPVALRGLCERAIDVIDPGCAGGAAASPAVRRALRGAVAVARGCAALAAVAAPAEAPRLAREADAAAERAGAVLATYARGV